MIDDPSVRFDYYCWDVYSKMASVLRGASRGAAVAAGHAARDRAARGRHVRIRATIARAIVKRHIATMLRLGITYDLLPKESDIIALHFWDRAFELLKAAAR